MEASSCPGPKTRCIVYPLSKYTKGTTKAWDTTQGSLSLGVIPLIGDCHYHYHHDKILTIIGQFGWVTTQQEHNYISGWTRGVERHSHAVHPDSCASAEWDNRPHSNNVREYNNPPSHTRSVCECNTLWSCTSIPSPQSQSCHPDSFANAGCDNHRCSTHSAHKCNNSWSCISIPSPPSQSHLYLQDRQRPNEMYVAEKGW